MHDLRAGDWVEVCSQEQIEQTLDADGTLDGLPFMPEMLEFCGRKLRVLRRAEKSCVEVRLGVVEIREFRQNDVVILDGLRCSGACHGGCQRGCILFWKAAWLRKPKVVQPSGQAWPSNPGDLRAGSKPEVGGGRFRCQSTQLAAATQGLPRVGILKKCVADLRSGSRGVLEMSKLILIPTWRKATWRFRQERVAGTLKKTPVEALNLQPGEWVEVKSRAEIERTLDAFGRNRGLVCVAEMARYCGRKYRVKSRLDRMIMEHSGEMRKVENTVILEGIECRCWNVLGGCPRQELMYWREIWLKRLAGDEGPVPS